MNTCDECKSYKFINGYCHKRKVYRHSCGEEACDDFELADDLKEIAKNTKQEKEKKHTFCVILHAAKGVNCDKVRYI